MDEDITIDGTKESLEERGEAITQHLPQMYQSWFLDYASYVILERAVPHIGDGFKPVQRRIMHTMKRLDDGRYNKVANIVGHAMQFHPHGDASIKDALVQLGQKELLIDCQGNWGNIITGDDAAAARYIEARLSKFALDVVFNPKTTEWKLSYDGRNKEPVTLPVKFPLLLAQGADGIAVGLNCKILPHNFCEICDAAISYLHGEDFRLLPDFPTGGSIDVGKYNDGQRGGSVRVRAKIEKRDTRTLAITEIPYGKTTGTASKPSTFVDSILRAAEKGKIKVRKVEDLTAAKAEILIHLTPGASSDKTIDALYACTDCEVSISPNCCVIEDRKPRFLSVSDVLRNNVDTTLSLLRKERLIRRGELMESLHFATLEQIFIEERIYKDKNFEEAKSNDEACEWIDKRLTPWYPKMVREVTKEDILRLLEIKMQRILRFNKDKAKELIAHIKAEVKQIDKELANMTEVTADWFRYLKEKYGPEHPRLTEIKNFDTITAATVVEANQKLYINRAEGFIGTSLRKDEFVCNCSDIDDVILFWRDGTYKITHIADKLFVGETERSRAEKRKAELIHVAIFKRGDTRTVYNVVYTDGKNGKTLIKRFTVTAVVRDREYDLTQGKPGSLVRYFTSNPNGEAEIIRVTLKPMQVKSKKLSFDKDFSDVAIKSRQAVGNLLTKAPVARISLKSHGASTLGGRQVWFDNDVKRLNYDSIGQYLGEFNSDDRILVILRNGEFYTSTFDTNNHYEDNILRIEKADPRKTWTLCLFDAEQGFTYLKRFTLQEATARHQQILGDNTANQLLLLTDTPYPLLQISFSKAERVPMEVDAEQFVAVKGFKAKGKRLTTLAVESVTELPPAREPETEENEPATENEEETEEISDESPATERSDDEIKDELTGQLRLFD
ncbi:MAG: DNA gyrase/topoisomerase IV subunit A [Prevotellaceae bacterium]|nr:DNA gyrase/topoisomerase IV subunit A [Prevotellaceae bacterium]